MKANEFFENEEIEAKFEKIPEGDTYIKKESLEISKEVKEIVGVMKDRYNLSFLNKKDEQKEFEVGISIVRGIKKCMGKPEPYIRITREGTTKEDTKYTTNSVE